MAKRAQSDEKLTGIQLDVMETVWAKGKAGATVAEIWQDLSGRRPLARTTVLTMVVRLERRGWLARSGDERPARFRATRGREQAAGRLAVGFVDEFFGGSAAGLVMSLLGSKRLKAEEIASLRELLKKAEGKK